MINAYKAKMSWEYKCIQIFIQVSILVIQQFLSGNLVI